MNEWGAICNGLSIENPLVSDVVCRQLGFPHGTIVDPTTNPPDPVPGMIDYYAYPDYAQEEAEEPSERFWLDDVFCRGPEARLIDCQLGQGFRQGNAGCTLNPLRVTIACRKFAVSEALEDVTTPRAGALPL